MNGNRNRLHRVLVTGLFIGALATIGWGAESPLLIDESFAKATLPATWERLGPADGYTVADGVLKGVTQAKATEDPSLKIPVKGHSMLVQFRIKFTKPGFFLLLADGVNPFGGEAHLVRMSFRVDQLRLAQDRGSLESKKAQKVAADEAKRDGKPTPTPTSEQLADPKFYRTETLAKRTAKIMDGEWHVVKLEMKGNEITAQVDSVAPTRTKATVADVEKSALIFHASEGAEFLIDDVKVLKVRE